MRLERILLGICCRFQSVEGRGARVRAANAGLLKTGWAFPSFPCSLLSQSFQTMTSEHPPLPDPRLGQSCHCLKVGSDIEQGLRREWTQVELSIHICGSCFVSCFFRSKF